MVPFSGDVESCLWDLSDLAIGCVEFIDPRDNLRACTMTVFLVGIFSTK